MHYFSCFNKVFKRKSFHLNRPEPEPRTDESDGVFNTKHVRWLRFLVVPLLIGFALLLVLSNVDFSDDSKVIHANTTELEALKSNARGTAFLCDGIKSCKTIICTGGPIYTLSYALEEFGEYCGSLVLDVILENCTFNERTIALYTMSGRYNLNSLTIRNCELENIMDNAFKQSTVKNLFNLTFEGVHLKSLNGKSFIGLEAIENFKLLNIQKAESTSLSVEQFLQPMTVTLRTLVVQQSQVDLSSLTTYDPKKWLEGKIAYHKLVNVDLSGTYFDDTLNRDTFVNLLAVRQLWLVNCNLTVIGEHTFDCILPTIELIDLRNNQLHMLDGEFLASVEYTGISIEMAGNQWSCLCENAALVEFVKESEGIYSAEPECASPIEMRGVEIRNVELNCHEITTVGPNYPSFETISSTSSNKVTDTTAVKTTKTEFSDSTDYNITKENPTPEESTSADTSPQTSSAESTYTEKVSTTSPMYTTTPPDYQDCPLPLPTLLSCNFSSATCDYNGNFSIEVISPTSVLLRIGVYEKLLEVFYFESLTYNATYVGQVESGVQDTQVVVNQLESNHSYTFCLVQYLYWRVSSFDCRSAHLPEEVPATWLNNKDKAPFYSIATFITVFCGIVGGVAVYWLLRWRPILLWGNKRLRRVASTSHEVLLFAKSKGVYLDLNRNASSGRSRIRSTLSDNLLPKNYADIKSHGYMQYFRNTDITKDLIVSHIPYNRPPSDRAPIPPHEYVDVLLRGGGSAGGVGGNCQGGAEKGCTGNTPIRHNPQSHKLTKQYSTEPNAYINLDECENEYESVDDYHEVY